MAKVKGFKRKGVRVRAKRTVGRVKAGVTTKKTGRTKERRRPRVSASDVRLHQSIEQRISEFCKYLEYRRDKGRHVGNIKKGRERVDPIGFINDYMKSNFPAISSVQYKEFLEYRSDEIKLWNSFLSKSRVRRRSEKINNRLREIENSMDVFDKTSKKHAKNIVTLIVDKIAKKGVSSQESTNIKRIVLGVVIAVLRDDNFHDVLRKYKSKTKYSKIDELVNSLINELLDFN